MKVVFSMYVLAFGEIGKSRVQRIIHSMHLFFGIVVKLSNR